MNTGDILSRMPSFLSVANDAPGRDCWNDAIIAILTNPQNPGATLSDMKRQKLNQAQAQNPRQSFGMLGPNGETTR